MEENSITGVETQAKQIPTAANSNKIALTGKADIVIKEEEKEEEEASPHLRNKQKRAAESGDDMASLGLDDNQSNNDSQGSSDTSIKKMENSFERTRKNSV